MADIAVSLLIERLADFLEEKVQLYRDVGKEARELKKDLESMQSWLEAADRSAAHNDIMKTLVNQVKEAACDAEDALDEYVLRLEENRGGCFGRIKQLKYGPPPTQIWSLEEVADGYLHQLIRRNLVQVSEWKHGEMVKTCQVHDIVREIIIYKYEEDGFFASSSSSSPSPVQMPSNRIRHLTICNSQKGTEINATQRYEGFTRLRSLFTFRAAADNAVPVTASSFARLRLLRVVSLENIPMDSFPDGLTQLLLLRYLSLENTNINKLPDSVAKLKHLQTLNLKGTMVRELSAAIHRLQSLRHLLVYKYVQGTFPFNCIGGVRLPPGIIRKLRSLQKLGYIVAAESGVVTEVGNLTQLRRLCVVKLSRKDGNDLCTSVAKMSHLQALSVTSVGEDEVVELQPLSRPLPALQRLYLSGRFHNLHQWIPSLDNLLVLRLRWSKLKDDPLKALQALPNLLELHRISTS